MPTTDPVQDIKDKLPIEALVAEYLPLKASGVNLKGLCPFHNEKTPSFMVSPERHSWHCFGCSKGGDVFSFVMEMEGMDFRETLEHLAKKTGTELPRYGSRKDSNASKKLYEINKLAMEFFENSLGNESNSSEEAKAALVELERRKVDQLTRDTFHIGFAPAAWDALTSWLGKKGYSESEMVAAGVAVARPAPKQGVYDRFRNRLTFPLIDVVDRTLGFSARAMDPEEKMGKYINSPETAIYKKSSFLYALRSAKREIRKRDFCILVEGQMDAISSYRVGVTNVVATSGTALTDKQLTLIKRYTSNLVLAFDVDIAGADATKRGIDLALLQGFNVKVATLQGGKDPDDLCRENPKAWGQALKGSRGIVDYYIHKSTRDRDMSQVESKKHVANTVLPEIARLLEPVEQTHYLQRLSRLLAMDESVLRRSMEKHSGVSYAAAKQQKEEPLQESSVSKTKSLSGLAARIARLIAVGLSMEKAASLCEPLGIVKSELLSGVRAVFTDKGSIDEKLAKVAELNTELAERVRAQLFAIDLEKELDDYPNMLEREFNQLVKLIVRESVKRDLQRLGKQVARAAGPAAPALQKAYSQKTDELASLEEDVRL